MDFAFAVGDLVVHRASRNHEVAVVVERRVRAETLEYKLSMSLFHYGQVAMGQSIDPTFWVPEIILAKHVEETGIAPRSASECHSNY